MPSPAISSLPRHSTAVAVGGAVAVPPRREQWLRVYGRVLAMLPRVEALVAGRARLEAVNELQNEFWEARDAILQRRLLQAEESRRRWEAAYIDLQPSADDWRFAELQESDFEDLTTFVDGLAEENTEFQIRLKEVEGGMDHSQNAADHVNITGDLKAELLKLKQAYEAVCSEATRVSEAAQELQQKVEQLQVASRKKVDEIHRLPAQAKAKAAETKRKLVRELLEVCCMPDKIEGETEKHKGKQSETNQLPMKDMSETRKKYCSEGPALSGETTKCPSNQMLAAGQPETNQKRKFVTFLSDRNMICETKGLRSHHQQFKHGVSVLRKQLQSLEDINREVSCSLVESSKQVHSLEIALKKKEDEITKLLIERQTEAEFLASANSIIIESADTVEQLRSQNKVLHDVSQKWEDEITACRKNVVDAESTARNRAAKDAGTIEDLQNQIKAIDDGLIVPAGLGDNLSSETRLERVQQLADLLKKIVTAGEAFAAKVSLDRLSSMNSIRDLPAILEGGASNHEEKLRSASRGGATIALALMMAHYPEANLGRVAAGFPMRYRDGTEVDANEVLESVSGHASKVAKAVIISHTFPDVPCPPTPPSTLESSDADTNEEDDVVEDASEESSKMADS